MAEDYIQVEIFPDSEPPVIRIRSNMVITDDGNVTEGNIYLSVELGNNRAGKFFLAFAQAYQELTDYLRKKGTHQ